MAVNIVAYNCDCESRMLDKTTYLLNAKNIVGTFRGEVNIVAPSFEYECSEVPTFNYVYIKDFNRYYFVRSIVSVRQNLYEITCDVDVLMTYKEDIKKSYCVISRNQFYNNPYIIDSQRVITPKYVTDIIPIPNNVFTGTGWTYVVGGIGLGARDA